MENVVSIILGVLAVCVTFISYYFSVKSKIERFARDAVNEAEDDGESGEEKMEIAVDQVCSMIPAILKPVFTREFVECVIQEAFDKMKEFAEKRHFKVDS